MEDTSVVYESEYRMEGVPVGIYRVELLGRGVAWLDTGTHEALLQAANFIQAVQERQGLLVSCPEEIAWRMGYITSGQLEDHAEALKNSGYGQYLLDVLQQDRWY